MSYQPARPVKNILTPSARRAWCFCLSILLLGPFGLIVGPVLSSILRKRAERLYPYEAGQARQRDVGNSWGAIWAMAIFGVLGIGMALLMFGPLIAIMLA